MKEKNSNTGIKVVMILSLILNAGLIGTIIFFYDSNSKQADRIETLSGEVSSLDTEVALRKNELKVISEDLERIREERDLLGLDNTSLNEKIEKLNSTMAQLERTSRLDSKKRRELEQMIAGLREEIITKDREIAKLIADNDSLATGINNLREEKGKLGDSLNTTMSALAYASILKAESFKIVGVKSNGKEIDDKEIKGSKIDRLKVSFRIADNKAAKKDNKLVYIALVQPSGEVFSDVANGGGTLTLENGDDVFFTLSQKLKFDNTNQELTFSMLKGFNYIPGNYSILAYSEGHKIGEGSFIIK